MTRQLSDLDYLIELSEGHLPAFIETLEPHDRHELRNYVESVMVRRDAGLDKLFESTSLVMKFIPNVILHSITCRYIDPPLAARIANKLTVRQAIGVTAGLPIEYIGETAAYLHNRHAVEILEGLKPELIAAVFEYLMSNYPLRGLDILEFASERTLRMASSMIDSHLFDESVLSHRRREVLNKLARL